MKDETAIEFECPGCQAVYEPAPERTIIITYDEPTYNHILTTCPACGFKLMAFFDNPAVLTLGYDIQHNYHAPQRVQEVFHGIMGGQPGSQEEEPEEEAMTYEERVREVGPLTDRLEGEVERMRRGLEATPHDLLFDALTAGAGKRDAPPGRTTLSPRWK